MTTDPTTDVYYADRLHRRDLTAEELETWVDEMEADEAEDDDCDDY